LGFCVNGSKRRLFRALNMILNVRAKEILHRRRDRRKSRATAQVGGKVKWKPWLLIDSHGFEMDSI
jgi:hypothetical protein